MRFDFRLIVDREHVGAVNMARDEAISRAVSAGAQWPTLRLYDWAPPAISLGQSQRISSVNEAACKTAGVDLVLLTYEEPAAWGEPPRRLRVLRDESAWSQLAHLEPPLLAWLEPDGTVRDLRLRRNVRVKAGRTYVALARAPRPR